VNQFDSYILDSDLLDLLKQQLAKAFVFFSEWQHGKIFA